MFRNPLEERGGRVCNARNTVFKKKKKGGGGGWTKSELDA